ncbi:DUF3604 domain-containing protein [Microbulbifer elongatus]|uniref:DUF3604 domain-containing protein n=1 Tax=Microbulbifer elongatus TaxID=86173 RepID=A0ABT1NZ79_9GAMM|nr:DUF3604 domain-containing protein [Microbulbifer elongatus]MCQ3828169.1 DUF3604 domain-containing protein [Microbulbifer elongatus]
MKPGFRSVSIGATFSALLSVSISPYAADDPANRQVFFGEQHLHTSWSFDAYIFGNTKSTPAQAYEYAKGKPLKHALGYEMKISQPLDWLGVTDHSEYVGVIQVANTPGSDLSKTELGKKLVVHSPADIQRIYLLLGRTMIDNKPFPELVAPKLASSVWDKNNAAADAANEPGKFTAFNAYEWTSTPNNANLHRNVYFKDGKKLPKMPFSSFDSQAPEDLWAWMDKQRAEGVELLAISHNADVSDGLMFPMEVNFKGRPIDKAWAEARMRNEPLTEIKQIKGQSETHPLLSPNDEFADYEVFSYLLGDPPGKFPKIPGSYVRDGLKTGIAMQGTRGYNPYKTGVVGGSDSHNGAAPYRQDNFFGGHAKADGGLKERMRGHLFAGLDTRLINPAGLTAIWAEENTRASLFEGMKRKETFATSGTRLKLRFFGGWDFDKNAVDGREWVKGAYAKGVPMGGDLTAAESGKAPTFIVWAVKDPTSGNLDRVQIVKGWSKDGQAFEKVYDVVWAGDRSPDALTGKVPAIGSTVNIMEASYKNSIGKTELKTVWTDPDFDPALDAFYYARVLEIPTPRWTTIQAKELGITPPTNVPATVQERAWSSPIWYTPTSEFRQKAKAGGMRIADLKQQGGKMLTDAELKTLVVGKSTWLKNLVTGSIFRIVWEKNGQRTFWNINPADPIPQHFGFASKDSYLGLPTRYEIKDNQIVEDFGNGPMAWTAFKSGDKTLLSRSDEFGFANYEIIETPKHLIDLDSVKRK